MEHIIQSKQDLDRLLPGRFEVLAEVRRGKSCTDTVRLARILPNEFHRGGITASGWFNNHHGGFNMDGTTSFDDLLEVCRDEESQIFLDRDYNIQQTLRTRYGRHKAESEYLSKQ